MNDLRDYLQKKAAELGLERGDQLAEIQVYLDELYPGQCRAASLNDGVLKITTPNASVASELRMGQTQLLVDLKHYEVLQLRLSVA
jgi:hypothetical protein